MKLLRNIILLFSVFIGFNALASVSYSVAFNANGGTGTMANESFVTGTAKALTINTFTRTGYIFIGWATSSSATTSTYDDGASVKDLTTTSGATVTLYAVWQANAYTIVFKANGGSGSMANLAMKYDTAKALTANAFQRVNYNFIGWSTSSSATSATYTNKQSVKNLTATVDGTVTLYAVWQTVREITALTARPRYPWNGLVDIDMTFRAAGLSAVSFEIKDTTGGTNLNAKTFYVGNPEKNVRTLEVQPGTHRFVWDAAADLGAGKKIPFAVTAKVVEKMFQVNVSGGTGSGSFLQGKSATVTAAAKTGYTFAAWTGTSSDVSQLASATAATTTLTIPSRDVSYTATYTPNTYTVKFNANGGSGTMAYESFTYDTAKALTANAFTRTGWDFLGWGESATATTPKYTDKQSVKNLVTSGTKNLYAVWNRVGVQLWANGPYWDACNVGALQPEEAGYYFWWGDTVGYTYNGSQWVSADGKNTVRSFSSCPTDGKKISTLQSEGYIDSSQNLVAKYDAATVKLGSSWRIPTVQEFRDLGNNVTFENVTSNGVYGTLIKGKGSYASRSIFLPMAGYGYSNNLNKLGTEASFWSSTAVLEEYNIELLGYMFYSKFFYTTSEEKAGISSYKRLVGRTIRAVRSAK